MINIRFIQTSYQMIANSRLFYHPLTDGNDDGNDDGDNGNDDDDDDDDASSPRNVE